MPTIPKEAGMTLLTAYLSITVTATLLAVLTVLVVRPRNAPVSIVAAFLGSWIVVASLWDLFTVRYHDLPKVIPTLFQPFI